MDFNLARGFLPSEDPLQKLPLVYHLWEELAENLPKILLSNSMREIFNTIPVLSTHSLVTKEQLERAMMLLSFFCHAYVWGKKPPSEFIPASIAIPLSEVAKQLDRPPVLSYASYALNNWRRIEVNAEVELGNIVLQQNFLGGLDEEWFVLVHVDIEMKAASALQQFLPSQQAAAANNFQALEKCLATITNALEKMCQTLDRMPENCDPYIYYHRVRPYIHGWKDNPALPDGLKYEGVVEYRNIPQKFRGETGAQSSIIPAFDALFGVTHREDPLRIYLMEMRNYMPSSHREFIKKIEHGNSIRAFIIQHKETYPNLQQFYNQCIHLLSRFRQTHLKYAAQYIQKQSQDSLANPTDIGTGGTPFMEYLKKHKDETLQFLLQ